MPLRPRSFVFAFIALACLAGVAAALLWRSHPATELAGGELLSPSRALPEFSLIDQRGQAFGTANLRGHWSLLFFGYTNCPDFCPTTLVTLAALDKKLQAAGALRPQVIFMSVDAQRDTPAQLAKYVPYFDPDFIGITAPDRPTIEDVARRLGVAMAITPQPDGSYSVDHSGSIYVLNPAGRLAAILSGPYTVDALQADLARIEAAAA